LDQQFLSNETKRARKTRAGQPHAQKTDRQQRHTLIASVISGQIQPAAARLEDENATREPGKRETRRQPHH